MSSVGLGRSVRALAVLTGFTIAGGMGHAQAAVVSFSPSVDFTSANATISFGPAAYIFSAIPGALPGDPPAAVATTGTAQVSNFFGVADFGAGATLDGMQRFNFASFASPSVIPFSAADDFIGLAFTLMDGLHYGYAEVAGTQLVSYGYETTVGAGIVTGAVGTVPEPATIALLSVGLLGIGAVRLRNCNTRRADQTAIVDNRQSCEH
jgi:hypothetical protein